MQTLTYGQKNVWGIVLPAISVVKFVISANNIYLRSVKIYT